MIRFHTCVRCCVLLTLTAGIVTTAECFVPDPFRTPWAYNLLGGYELSVSTSDPSSIGCPSIVNFTAPQLVYEQSPPARRRSFPRWKLSNAGAQSNFISRRVSLNATAEEDAEVETPKDSFIPHINIYGDGQVCGKGISDTADSALNLNFIDLDDELAGMNCSLIHGEDSPPMFTRTCGNNTLVAVTAFTNCLTSFLDDLVEDGISPAFNATEGAWYMGIYSYSSPFSDKFGCWYRRTFEGPPLPSPAPSLSPLPSPKPESEPSPEATSELVGEGESACFPAAGEVQLKGGGVKRMDELEIGDTVVSGPNEYSPVFAFTHRDNSATHSFIRITMSDSKMHGPHKVKSLTLTKTHYMYRDRGELVMAGSVRAGDKVTLADGAEAEVHKVEEVHDARGLYNPQTLSGDIVVDGVLVSTYTGRVEPGLAHALLAPLRGMFRLLRKDITADTLSSLPYLANAKL